MFLCVCVCVYISCFEKIIELLYCKKEKNYQTYLLVAKFIASRVWLFFVCGAADATAHLYIERRCLVFFCSIDI